MLILSLPDSRRSPWAHHPRLLDALDDSDFGKEFSQPWGGFVGFELAKFREELKKADAAASEHDAALKKHAGRGKSWDHDLKRLHVYMAACFCEYFHHSFEPSRMSGSGKEEPRAFQEAVERSPSLGRFSNLSVDVAASPVRYANISTVGTLLSEMFLR